jgi:Flp pilus assembly protein TadG
MLRHIRRTRTLRYKRKGQALVELALASLLLALLLAAAIDFGRAFYTAVVVENMAGEGAAYAALQPDHDANYPSGCSKNPVVANQNIQDRARQVAQDRGLIIHQPSQASVVISPSNCLTRCVPQNITVTVSYRIDDLFLPRLLGMSSLTISKSSVQQMTASSYAAICPTP